LRGLGDSMILVCDTTITHLGQAPLTSCVYGEKCHKGPACRMYHPVRCSVLFCLECGNTLTHQPPTFIHSFIHFRATRPTSPPASSAAATGGTARPSSATRAA
jgi:hypothetical protein